MVWWQHCYKLCFCASNYNGSSGIKLTKSQQSEQTACLGSWFRYVFAITFTEDQAIVRVQEIPNLMNLCEFNEFNEIMWRYPQGNISSQLLTSAVLFWF